ncbi:MAG: hypothetical protein ACPG5B_11120 [Chitinophagales bacterium]
MKKPHLPKLNTFPSKNLNIIVVIPCHDETNLLASLQALRNCDASTCAVEVIVVINHSENSDISVKQQNENTFLAAQKWITNTQQPTDFIQFYLIKAFDLPKKHAGVGLARKIGMDEAAFRLHQINRPKGIIACFDADSLCQKNYFVALEKHFIENPKNSACSIYFEHDITGNEYDENVYKAIILYELHLRYYVHALRFANFPYAYQTIGSSMAVRAKDYLKQGGMNRRKAGEDFYFLHKFIPLGTFTELKETIMLPSSRPSHRVPFGTGKAVQDILDKKKMEEHYPTYHFQIFQDLKVFLSQTDDFYLAKQKEEVQKLLDAMPKSIQMFLEKNHFEAKLQEIQNNTTNLASFRKRFFHWFSAFIALKYVHFARDNFYPNISVTIAAKWLLEHYFFTTKASENSKNLLLSFREIDKKQAQA